MTAILERTDAEATRACERTKAWLDDLISQVREDIVKTNDPRARALFETTAEVLSGLKTAYVHYEAGIEPGFQMDARLPSGPAVAPAPPNAAAKARNSSDPASLGES